MGRIRFVRTDFCQDCKDIVFVKAQEGTCSLVPAGRFKNQVRLAGGGTVSYLDALKLHSCSAPLHQLFGKFRNMQSQMFSGKQLAIGATTPRKEV